MRSRADREAGSAEGCVLYGRRGRKERRREWRRRRCGRGDEARWGRAWGVLVERRVRVRVRWRLGGEGMARRKARRMGWWAEKGRKGFIASLGWGVRSVWVFQS